MSCASCSLERHLRQGMLCLGLTFAAAGLAWGGDKPSGVSEPVRLIRPPGGPREGGAGEAAPAHAAKLLEAALAAEAREAETMEDVPPPPVAPNPNLPTPTLGGRQLWGDVAWFQGWRIQQHVFTRHYRLLDPRNIRQAWGTRDQCAAQLARFRRERQLPPMSGSAVILVHGIGRSSRGFSKMQEQMRRAGFSQVIGFDYPSTRIDIAAAADYLHQVVDSLDGVHEVHFVTHSLGGLVVREYLAEHRDPRAQRVVMLGTPNYGANLADMFRLNPLYLAALGPAGQQLGRNPQSFVWELPPPRCEFAVIAGGLGNGCGYNLLIPGDDDAIVSVESAFLAGAADSAVLPVLHFQLPSHPEIMDQTIRFLQTGRLRNVGPRLPIPPRTVAKTKSQEIPSQAALSRGSSRIPPARSPGKAAQQISTR